MNGSTERTAAWNGNGGAEQWALFAHQRVVIARLGIRFLHRRIVVGRLHDDARAGEWPSPAWTDSWPMYWSHSSVHFWFLDETGMPNEPPS